MQTLRVGIIGAGWIARKLALTMHTMAECQCYAIAARDLARAEAFAHEWGCQRAYGSYEELVQDPNVDLVYIATPHSLHFQHAMLALRHGKPCLVEKAFTANAHEAESLLHEAEQRGLFITEAIWTRYHPIRRTIQTLLESGIIGDIRQVEASLSYPMEQKERILRPDLCGGAMLDLGVYPLNFLRMVMPIESSTRYFLATLSHSGVDMNDSLVFTYFDGSMAILSAGAYTAGDNRGIVRGTRGWLEVDNCNNPTHVWVYGSDRQLLQEFRCPATQTTGYEYELLACREALQKGWLEHPDMPHAETLYIMRLMDDFRAAVGVRYPSDPA